MIRTDASELASLALEMPKLGAKGAKAISDVLVEGGKELRDLWAANATKTAGKHGRWYPKSIESRLLVSTDIVVEVGPNPNKPQGGMSFENGSVNQPPHNDGKKAADEVLPTIEKKVVSALGLMGL